MDEAVGGEHSEPPSGGKRVDINYSKFFWEKDFYLFLIYLLFNLWTHIFILYFGL